MSSRLPTILEEKLIGLADLVESIDTHEATTRTLLIRMLQAAARYRDVMGNGRDTDFELLKLAAEGMRAQAGESDPNEFFIMGFHFALAAVSAGGEEASKHGGVLVDKYLRKISHAEDGIPKFFGDPATSGDAFNLLSSLMSQS